MGAIDFVIIILFILGFLEGWRKGLLTSAVNFAANILIFVLALILKGPISLILIEHLPFINFSGIFADITALNIILYEGIAFIIVALILTILFRVLLKFTGLLNRVINATILFGLPNKIGGALINLLRYYLIAFILSFVISLIPAASLLVKQSLIADNILNKTPILSSMTKNLNESLTDIYNLVTSIDANSDTEEINKESLEILLKYGIIKEETVNNLNESGKLKIDNFEYNKGDKND
ncbi:MAG: CvpA family protein [Erysipelotrichales bacterium]|nr:CvpA family protein [Erysipelotrichales bacterium]